MVGVARITGGSGAMPDPLGTEVVVGYADVSGGQRGVRTQIGLTVLAVRRGTQEELEANGFQVDSEDKDATPYYIDARFANNGRGAVKRNLGLGLEDSGGDLVRWPLLIFRRSNKTFEPCSEVNDGTLEPGESYKSCTLVLVSEDVDVAKAKVYFLSDNGPNKEPEFVYWATE
jgi:hypothetical protein